MALVPAAAVTISCAKIKSVDAVAGWSIAEHQIREQGHNQYGGEYAPWMLQAVGDDLPAEAGDRWAPGPEQQLLHGARCRSVLFERCADGVKLGAERTADAVDGTDDHDADPHRNE